MDLCYKAKSAWEGIDDEKMEVLNKLSNDYIDFLNHGKTERECAKEIITEATKHGFKSLDEVLKDGAIKKGTKVYLNHKDKAVVLMVIGEDMTDRQSSS